MSSPGKPTISEAIYVNTQILRKLLQPISVMAEKSQAPAQQSPLENLLSVQEAMFEAIRQLRDGQDRLFELLSSPNIAKAVEDLLKAEQQSES